MPSAKTKAAMDAWIRVASVVVMRDLLEVESQEPKAQSPKP
jgi:hypothetical protein